MLLYGVNYFLQVFQVPEFIVPRPFSVLQYLAEHPNIFMPHFCETIKNSFIAITISSLLGWLLSVSFYFNKMVERIIMPFVILSQTFPKEALAPVFALLFGFGSESKIALASLISFFPIVINVVRAQDMVPLGHIEYFRSIGATDLQIFILCVFPFTIPSMFVALRAAASLSLVGVVVGDFIGGTTGLGYIIKVASSQLAPERAYAALVLLGIIGFSQYILLIFIEKKFRGISRITFNN